MYTLAIQTAAVGKCFPGMNSTFHSAKEAPKTPTTALQGSLQPATSGVNSLACLMPGVLCRCGWPQRCQGAVAESFQCFPGGMESAIHAREEPLQVTKISKRLSYTTLSSWKKRQNTNAVTNKVLFVQKNTNKKEITSLQKSLLPDLYCEPFLSFQKATMTPGYILGQGNFDSAVV